MSEPINRAIIKTIVESISEIGVVYDYQRWAVKYRDFLDFFLVTIQGIDQIRGWIITCIGFSAIEAERTVSSTSGMQAEVLRSYRYIIRGYFGSDDANESEKTALAKAVSIIEALDVATTLHDGDTFTKMPPAQLNTLDHRMFGSVLCHFIEIEQIVNELVVNI